MILEAQAAALDTALSDEARVAALSKLQRGPVPSAEAFDPAVVAAALQIATHSRQAEARARAWQWIRRLDVHDPLLAPPLLAALADDPAPEVRRVAALMLGSYLGEPGVADALAQAVADDPDDRPTQSCCVPTVRETARRALLFAEEPHAVVRKILLDESLPPHDRLMLYGPDGVNLNLTGLGDDAARAVFAIGANAADADIRQTAWLLIKDVRDPSFTRVLLDDLARHPSGDVRAAAAAALTLYRDAPGVSAALERAQRDPVDAVQQAARAALAGDRGMSFGRP
ncbi:MAG TPA: HEAT repeat domain-containing protein [Gammaproteobacteria bacterium]|nr:HEAT repeat domain-containing protein [Gammaproteobacteria bacterium]